MELYYSKLAFTPTLFYKDEDYSKIDLLIKILTKESNTYYRSSSYTLIDVEKIEINGVFGIYGKLVKYADKEEGTVDVKQHKSKPVIVEDKIIASSIFVINFIENNLLYSEVKNHINKNSFIERFNEILWQNNNDEYRIFDVELNPINENYSFYGSLKKLSIIYDLELKIVPTNPNANDIIADLDSRLKQQNVKEKTIKYKGKSTGIVLDEEIKSNTVYTDVGYGVGKAFGIDEHGNPKRIFSKKQEKQKRTHSIDTKNMSANELVQHINSMINDEIKRKK